MPTIIENKEYTFLNHIIFDGVASNELFYCTDMSYSLLDKDVQTTQLGKQDGITVKDVRYAEKEFSLDILFTTDQLINKKITNIHDLRRTIANYFDSNEPKEMIWTADPALYRKVIYTGTTDIEFLNNSTCTAKVTFLNPSGIEYARDSKITTNQVPSSGTGNLFIQPEFAMKTKYFASWSFVEPNERFNGSRVLTGFHDTSTDSIYHGEYHRWVTNSVKRRVNLSKGDSVSASLWVRLNEPANGRVFLASIEEYNERGKNRTYWQDLPLPEFILGEWVQIKLENYKIKGSDTKYISLLPRTVKYGNFSISKPQINLGERLTTYEVTPINLDDTIKIENRGTYKAYPILRAKMNGESGLLAFVNSNGGVLQFGNPQALDGSTAVRSDRVLYGGFEGKLPTGSIMNQGISSYPIHTSGKANTMKGSFSWKNKDVATPVWASNANDMWNGPSFTVPIDKNANNQNTGDFSFTNRFNFRSGVRECHRIEFALIDDNNKHFLGFVMRDSSGSRKELIAEFHINDAVNTRSFNLDLKKFDGGFFEIQINRKGNKVTFQLGQITNLKGAVNLKKDAILSKTYTDDAYKNRPIEKSFYWAMRWANGTVGTINFTDTKFTWVNTPYWKDIKNIYDDQDEVEVDVQSRKLYVNGVEAQDSAYHSIANEWEKFVLNPYSDTEVQVVSSSWALTPEIEAEFTETFI
ncbi:hypothetical protein DOK78_002361 [Enterococcus sp. DIV2402]|uniref:Phage tail protein n=1 Tax=Candidatus Enterococcus lowellii TaxID=2230877 RepID=A0ABZ2SPM3_9ENTE|nr:distal tail protein Dit [Enterococcus sp. DIV2402]MBO0463520.1 phage tail family protein [Enterococcus sp. DIV2402]